MLTIAEQLANLAKDITYDRLPEEVVQKTKATILDTIGCAFGGLQSDPHRIVRAVFNRLGGAPDATVIGSPDKVSILAATWINGTAIRYLDYNDTIMSRDPGHPSGNFAAVLAVAEREGVSGRDLMTGLVYAYELQLRLCDHVGEPCLWTRGWDHPTNMTYSSAGATAKLLGLSPDKIAHALVIAGAQSNFLAEIRQGVIGKIKGTAEGKAAGDGVMAALMAAEGLTGPIRLFEGKYGHINIMAGGADVAALTGPIKRHKMMRTYLKYYPIETMTQAPVKAALDLRAEHKIDPSQIERVVVGLYDFAFKKPSWDPSKLRPTTRESADHSFNYCVAVALLDGEMTAAQFYEDRIKAPDVQSLLARTELVVDPEIEGIYPSHYPGIVTVHMRDGSVYRKRADHFPGDPKMPMTTEQLYSKFRAQVEKWLPSNQTQEIMDVVENLERVDDIRSLTRLLAGTCQP